MRTIQVLGTNQNLSTNYTRLVFLLQAGSLAEIMRTALQIVIISGQSLRLVQIEDT